MSIESKHGVNRPDYVPPKSRGEQLTETGEKLQSAGQLMTDLGGAIVKIVFFGVLFVIVVLIAISAMSSHGSSTGSGSITKTNCEHPSAAEPCEGRALEEWHREHGETPLRVQDGEEAPSAAEQATREAKTKEAEASSELIREGESG